MFVMVFVSVMATVKCQYKCQLAQSATLRNVRNDNKSQHRAKLSIVIFSLLPWFQCWCFPFSALTLLVGR